MGAGGPVTWCWVELRLIWDGRFEYLHVTLLFCNIFVTGPPDLFLPLIGRLGSCRFSDARLELSVGSFFFD